jgi:predicted Zn finger-like uncharacterized protein
MLAPMKTECPHCHTLFRLTQEQLDMAGGQVRCGYCKEVFNALQTDFSKNNRQLDVFEHTPLAEYEKLEDDVVHQANEHIRANTIITPVRTESEADVPSQEHETIGLLTEEPDKAIPSQFRADAHDRHSTLSTLSWSAAILLLIAGLVTEYAWFNRDQLLNQHQLQPYIAALCGHIRCDGYISLRDPGSIEMLSRNVYTHPNEKNALMITATMINHADFAQALPDVQIDFSSTRGDVVASRRFKPAEYLQSDHDALRPMQPDTPVTFNLEVVDPGKNAITYEFQFL